ncbi:MAG: cyanophycin synthetase, partial [Gemmatimonadota bacterium]
VPRMLARTLVAAGVPPGQVVEIPDEQEAIEHVLRSAAPGDLVLIFADALQRSWNQVTGFRPEGRDALPRNTGEFPIASPTPAPRREPRVPLDGANLVRDERGVRLARENDD